MPTATTTAVRVIGLLTTLAGVLLIVAGAATWYVVRDQLVAENVTVHDDAAFLAGNTIDGPIDALIQADVIRGHALAESGGLTYAELDRDHPARGMVMTASTLRTSLFTSVIAFGVAALVAGIGVLMLLIGVALRRIARALDATGALVVQRPADQADAPERPVAQASVPERPVTPSPTPEPSHV